MFEKNKYTNYEYNSIITKQKIWEFELFFNNYKKNKK